MKSNGLIKACFKPGSRGLWDFKWLAIKNGHKVAKIATFGIFGHFPPL